MSSVEEIKVESETISDFARVMQPDAYLRPCQFTSGQVLSKRLNLDKDDVKNGLGQLVLTIIKLLHELLERQAIRRIEAGSLSNEEIERLGITLMRQAQEIDKLRREFGLEEEDLNIDLGPLGRLL